jgi:hypothetical protein
MFLLETDRPQNKTLLKRGRIFGFCYQCVALCVDFWEVVNLRSDGNGFHANIIFRENAIIDFQFSGKAFFC